MASTDPAPAPAPQEYYPHVRDFERNAQGTPIVDSVRGPARIEARQQITRERVIMGAEMKVRTRRSGRWWQRDDAWGTRAREALLRTLLADVPSAAQVLQDKIRWCYYKEGVNHYELCKDLAASYLELLKVRLRLRRRCARPCLPMPLLALSSTYACTLTRRLPPLSQARPNNILVHSRGLSR